jgi:hypothetical protein
LKDGYLRTIPIALIVGAIGIGASAAVSLSLGGGIERFYNIYLVNFNFLLSIAIGCLFFVTVTHLVRAGWSVTVRRLSEFYAACLTPMFLLFLPILMTVLSGSDSVYPWVKSGYSVHIDSEAEAVVKGEVIAPPIEILKASYLNPTWFTIRVITYFVIWTILAWFFLRTSLKQDETGSKSLTLPLWFSTMFPVYFFAGGVGGAFATLIVTAFWLQATGRVTDEITTDHYHDLGKLLFGWVVFWGYIGFSQFMLIWYANIPEETFWYDIRINRSGWEIFSLILLIGRFFIPFFLIMGRTARRNKRFLAASAVLLLCMHWVDHYWMIMPLFESGHRTAHVEGGVFAFNPLIDLTCAVGMIAVFIAFFCLIARDRSLIPQKDPRLGDALNHVVP